MIYFIFITGLIIVLTTISKHDCIVQLFKFLKDLLVIVILQLIILIYRDPMNIGIVYSFSIVQYLIVFIKKYYLSIIKSKLENSLYYDEMLITSILVYATDYCLILRFILVEDIKDYRRIVVFINFIIIQTRAILNVNIILEIYKYCLKNKLAILLNIPLFQYFYILATTLLLNLYKHFLQLTIIIIIKSFYYLIQKAIAKDNERSKQLLLRNAKANGYLQFQIEIDHIDQLD